MGASLRARAVGPNRIAHPRAGEFVDHLDDLKERLHVAVGSDMWPWFIDLNREFHSAIFARADNPPLQEPTRVAWGELDTLFAASSLHLPSRTAGDLSDHDELVRMLRDPEIDPLALELAARRHRGRTAAYLEKRVAVGR